MNDKELKVITDAVERKMEAVVNGKIDKIQKALLKQDEIMDKFINSQSIICILTHCDISVGY